MKLTPQGKKFIAREVDKLLKSTKGPHVRRLAKEIGLDVEVKSLVCTCSFHEDEDMKHHASSCPQGQPFYP